MVGTTSLRAIRLAILFLLFATTNLLAEPTSYECAPGTPKKGVGCVCPATHVARLSGAGAATCEPKPAPTGRYVPQGGNYDQLVQQANDHADAYNCTKAEEVYQKALQLRPNGLEALVGSGNCLARQSKWTNAHARFDKALAIDRKYEPALWGKAEAYRLAYKKDDAIAAYKQYLVYYPGTIKAQQQLEKLGAGPAPVINTTNRPGRYPSRTADVWCSVSGSSITCNGVAVSGKPYTRDFEGIYGKPDRTWDTKGGVNKVHTWDRLGIVVYEPMDGSGKAISMTMPFKPMGMAYDPSTNFGGHVTVDGYPLTGSTDLSDVIKKPGVTQPYSSTSALYAKGDFNVFMTGRNGPLDLVELSLWKNDTGGGNVTQGGGGGRYKTTQELKITVNNGAVQLNGVSISGKPKMSDIERIYGRWDRVWDTGSSNRVYTWDKLGLVAYENRDANNNPTGNCISTTFPYKPMGSSYDPKTMFDGSITVDGRAMTKYNTIATIKTRPNAGQPYGADSIVFDWGDVHVFTIAKSGGAIDLVEVSYWNKDRGMSTKKSGGKVANAADVRVEVSKTGQVSIQGVAISGKPMVSDFKKVYGEPDRVWDTKGGANRIHTWDSLGIIVYEPYNGRAISLTMPYKKMSGTFSPSTLFKGRVSLDGRGFYNFNTIGTIKNRTGATQPYGATSVVFDFGDVHVFTTAPQATIETIDLVEVSFWNKNR